MTTIPSALHDLEEPFAASVIDATPVEELLVLQSHFADWAHAGQLAPPPLPSGRDWRTWVMMAGRGFGKTRAGAEWVLGKVRGEARSVGNSLGLMADRGTRNSMSPDQASVLQIALVAATVEEAWRVMVAGPSGLLSLALPGEVAEASVSSRVVRFASGAVATLFSGRSPERLRGPEHDFAWCDELAKWTYPQETWDMLQMGMRRGAHPQVLVTTTPRPGPVLTRILSLPGTVETGGATWDNPHLAQSFVDAMEANYGGTRLSAQELEGRLLSDVEGSLWPVELIERCRVRPLPTPDPSRLREGRFVRVVIGVDPPASAQGTCGIVVAGKDGEGRAFVLDDASVSGRSPEGWARAVVAAADRWEADRVVVEANQGGDMVVSVLRAADADLPIHKVHARVGKAARAEPVATLFENGRAFFAGYFGELEEQLQGFVAGGDYVGPRGSPDRADACVWALTALMLGEARAEPRVRLL